MSDDIADEGEIRRRVDFWDNESRQVGGLQLVASLSTPATTTPQQPVQGALTTSLRSPKASPLSTELILTARSRMCEGAGWSMARRTRMRASAFLCGVTLSSRSYATQSAARERDLSRNFWDDPGTVYDCQALWSLYERCGGDSYRRAKRVSGCFLPPKP